MTQKQSKSIQQKRVNSLFNRFLKEYLKTSVGKMAQNLPQMSKMSKKNLSISDIFCEFLFGTFRVNKSF